MNGKLKVLLYLTLIHSMAFAHCEEVEGGLVIANLFKCLTFSPNVTRCIDAFVDNVAIERYWKQKTVDI